MLAAVQNIIPVITSEAGLCLTTQNWRDSGVQTVSCSLEFLLHKPGLAVLNQLTDLSHYLGWSGDLVVNAMRLSANKEGICVLKSPYDGSKVKISLIELVNLIQCLHPQAVILPPKILRDYPQIWEHWDDAILPFVHYDELDNQNITRQHGVYFDYSDSIDLERWSAIPRYVIGNMDLSLCKKLRNQGVDFIETDLPAAQAFQGKIYTHNGVIDINDDALAMQFDTIDTTCSCPTCSQQLTKAYFHHLFQHTPLLCQRFLIQHNLWFGLHIIGTKE